MSHVAPSDSRWTPVEVAATDAAMLQRIGRLRFDVWQAEGVLDASRFLDGIWLDSWDSMARHWVVQNEAGELIGAARLTIHECMAEALDGHVWLAAGRRLPGRIAHISKLVVARAHRGQGLGHALHMVRIQAARGAGADWVAVLASPANAGIVRRLGFADGGLDDAPMDTPGAMFRAFELRLPRTPDVTASTGQVRSPQTHPLVPGVPVEVPATDPAMLERIGRLRYEVWADEGAFDVGQAPGGVWLDAWDAVSRHWVVLGADETLLAAARLSVHETLAQTVDGHCWIAHGRYLVGRIANLKRLVARRNARGLRLGLALNQVRIAAAQASGADWIIGTATAPNAVLLGRLGFENVGMDHRADSGREVLLQAYERLSLPGGRAQ